VTRPLRVLVACEESQAVTYAFRALGHYAFSNDLVECSGGYPDWHLQCDAFEAYDMKPWDLVIAFPPCTDLAVSGARYFAEKRADGRQQFSIDFFMRFTQLTCPWAIENPIGIMSSHYRKPDQIIQPYQFGHDASKATCLWLNGLPLLRPTQSVPPGEGGRWANQTPSGQNKLGPSAERARLRSKTYEGIARAVAEQWSNYLTEAS